MRPRIPCVVGAVALAWLTSAPAAAQAPEIQNRAAAEQLFNDGDDAMARHDYETGCPKLEEVTRLLPGKIGAMHRLATCYEEWGKLASAWVQYRLVAATAPASDELKKASADKVAALEPRLPRLTITLAPEARALAGLEVRRDGVAVGAAQWGEAIPLDAGAHTVLVTATRKKAWSAAVNVTEGRPASIEVPALADVPAPLPGPSIPHGIPAWAWVAGGGGLVAGAVGIAVLATSKSGSAIQDEAANASCTRSMPTPQCKREVSASDTQQAVGGLVAGLGGVALGAAVVGMARARTRGPEQVVRLVLVPAVQWRGGGASLRGSFQ